MKNSLLQQIREEKPLVHHLTNWVTIYDCAQVVRSVGALPVMAHAKEEVADMVKIASSLVLNIGTLTPDFVEAQVLAAQAANVKGIPVVLDIVGCGATPLRTDAVKTILTQASIAVIKGNAGEVSALAGARAEVRGVESITGAENLETVAQNLAKTHNAVVVITSEKDIIADQNRAEKVTAGHAIMGRVVGTGCMATSVLGCFAAVEEDLFQACKTAMEYYGKAAEIAAEKHANPMAWKTAFFDVLAQ